MATSHQRGFYSSLQYVTLIAGQLVALLVLLLLQQFFLTSEQLELWGWRIPFFIGAILALIALYLRLGMLESSSFKSVQVTKRSSGIKALLAYPKQIFVVVGLTLGGTIGFYTYSTYMQKYLVNSVGMTKQVSTLVSAASLFFFMLLQPVVGIISDKIGRRPLLIGFGLLGSLGTVPLLSALEMVHTPLSAFFLIIVALAVVSAYTAINAVVKAELFPPQIRALGVGLPYALTVSIFGGTAEYVALWFKNINLERGFYWYVAGCIFISLLIYIFMPNSNRQSTAH
jgi:MHS family alpha-ketoglutarate permease-like MFS transporter